MEYLAEFWEEKVNYVSIEVYSIADLSIISKPIIYFLSLYFIEKNMIVTTYIKKHINNITTKKF